MKLIRLFAFAAATALVSTSAMAGGGGFGYVAGGATQGIYANGAASAGGSGNSSQSVAQNGNTGTVGGIGGVAGAAGCNPCGGWVVGGALVAGNASHADHAIVSTGNSAVQSNTLATSSAGVGQGWGVNGGGFIGGASK